jgi:DNA-binding response OmpR family regulator
VHRILLLDGDSVSLRAMQLVLQKANYEVACSQNATSGLALLPQFRPDVVVVDLHLPDMAAVETLRSLQKREPAPRCILVTRFGHDQDRDDAMKAGAFDCIDQPLTPGLLLAVVHNAVAGQAPDKDRATGDGSHALARWADVVVRAIRSPKDLTTLDEWGRSVGVSKGGLRNWCYTARLSPRHSLQFMRLLRAVIRRQGSSLAAEDLLDIVDRRTLAKLLKRAGGTATDLPESVVQFLDRQQLIQSAKAMDALRAALCLNGDDSSSLPRSAEARR